MVSVVMEAEVAMRFVTVAEPIRLTVADRSETVALVAAIRVTVAEVKVKLLMVALVAVKLVIVADEEVRVVMLPLAALMFPT